MPIWLILVTLLGGAFLVQRGNQPAEDKGGGAPPTSHAASEAASSDANDRLRAPLREFLGLTLQPSKVVEPSVLGNLSVEMPLPEKGRMRASAEWLGPTPAVERGKDQTDLSKAIKDNVGLLEFLVVMVADPIETATNYRFDLQLDTLHKALGADGYVPDHYYLPWNPQDQANRHRLEPGVLLYRRNGPSLSKCSNSQRRIDLLMVYLVGETTTSGIHKEAFLAAVRQIKTLEKMTCPPEPSPQSIRPKPDSRPTIRVAGPLFTGSADSLALAIRQWCDSEIQGGVDAGSVGKFLVITGTAVSIHRSRFGDLAGEGNVDLHSTVLYGRILRQALIKHVQERNAWKKVRIAWLTESGTGYGSSITINKRGLAAHKEDMEEKKQQERIENENSKSEDSQTNDASPPEVIEFSFPANISKVRAGYAESRRRERSGQASLGPESSRLPIPFEDASTARDVPPMQTPKVTAPTAELILAQILTRIRNEGIKYVGISSSDPRDAIFLTELIQEQCPDAQIMLVSSDVLFLHSEYRSIMHGTLVCSTYPLHPEALDWCFSFGEDQGGNSRSIVLSSQPNYGLYNAILFLRGLERGHYQHDDHADSDEANEDTSHNLLTLSYSKESGWPGGLPLGYSMPFEKDATGKGKLLRPPVWISRISSTGICPLTVSETDREYHSDYTLNLRIADPPKGAASLPVVHIRSRVPVSLYIASLVWLVAAAIYCAALLIPKLVGNWAKALASAADHPPEFQSLIYVFRCYITFSFLFALILFARLLEVFDDWVVQTSSERDYVSVVQYVLCYGVVFILILCLLADWGRALWGLAGDVWGALIRLDTYWRSGTVADWRRALRGLVGDLFGALKRSFTYLRSGPRADRGRTLQGLVGDLFDTAKRLFACLKSGPQPETATTPVQAAEPDLSWHLIAARGIGLAMILTLVVIFALAGTGQMQEWEGEGSHPDSFLWFIRTSDMWNGLSPAMTAQLLAAALIILAYGMLLQMHLLSPKFTIIRPDPSTFTPPSDAERQRRQEEVRSDLLFPLLSRWRRNRPVVLDILCVAAALLWLGFLGWHLQSPDHFTLPVNFPTLRLLFAGGFCCVRLFKLIQILKGLARRLEELTKALRERWPDTWAKIFEHLSEKPVGLQELFWASRPTVNDRELSKAKQALQEVQPDEDGRLIAEQKLCATEIVLYVRQFFHHIVRLGLGLAIAACLLFLSAHAFPFSQEPLVRLSASILLAAIGCVMAWYYLKFDRNELLSRIVGTDPKQVSVNWSMIQMIAPAILLTAVALLSQTFPEIWQWMRGVLEPMARSSI
ncbi:MAG: hypothetical protein ACR2FY_05010 [Pirellulaceae bacterium]